MQSLKVSSLFNFPLDDNPVQPYIDGKKPYQFQT